MPKLPQSGLSPWQEFKSKWTDCCMCPLYETRHNICLCRGNIPCDVLFVGEAPGPSEDAIGQPFVGPAGKLLDKQINEALENSGMTELRLGFTNLVCCIPRQGAGKGKFKEPPKECMDACWPRLKEFAHLCKPRLIVTVGDLSGKRLYGAAMFRHDDEPKQPEWGELDFVSITHPAAILRAEIVRQELMYHRSVVILESAFREL